MAIITSIQRKTPQFGNNCFFAENSVIAGDVIAGDNCSFWFNSVVRGDLDSIRIGDNVNIQDGAVLHTRNKKSKVEIGNNVTIAHHAVIHGAKIGNNVLIGIGAIILDGAEVGNNCIIGAGSVVLSGTIIKSYSLFSGNPAKFVKHINNEKVQKQIENTARNYISYGKLYDDSGK